MKRLSLLLTLMMLTTLGCAESGPSGSGGGASNGGDAVAVDGPKVAYVTNGIASFWVIAEKGAMDGGKEFGANVRVMMPGTDGVGDQKRMCQDLLAQGIDGIAISPIDPDNQGDLMKEIADNTNLITHDSDAPKSDRLCYVGMDNYDAGRMCGQLVKEAMPEGGTVMIFVGRLGQANARQRRQGVIDELLDRPADPARYDDPNDGEQKGDKYTILDTRTDGFDFAKAKEQAQDAIARYPDLGCMVGLFAYNPPLILDAVRDAGKVGEIKIVGFDEEDACLQGIIDGEIHGTTVQNPYEYGRKSVEILTALAKDDKSVIPEGGIIHIPARNIRKDNVVEFRENLKKLLAEGSQAETGEVADAAAVDDVEVETEEQPAEETTAKSTSDDPASNE
ncbi:MAG: sugar-binding protein [Planctomycetota bacterium]|jgi:ribose transport system substrate-binding protein